MKPKYTPLATALTSSAVLFALQRHADAAIIYSGIQNLTASIGAGFAMGTASVPFAGLNGRYFSLNVFRSAGGFGGAGLSCASGNAAIDNGSGHLKKLAAGYGISNARPFGYGQFLRSFRTGVPHGGTWLSNQTGFVAVKFSNGDLGWVRLKWTNTDSSPDPNTVTAIDWAYNDTPGESIMTPAGVPEPGTSALLALAAAGAAFLRRKRPNA